jgi:DNA polymerase III subunit delta'
MTAIDLNQEIIERFKRLAKANRLAHAYLFTGPAGTGKTEVALELAKLVNCEDEKLAPCGACVPCRKIASGNHPDVYMVGVEDEGIKIDEVRQMLGRIGLRAYEAKRKVFILGQVERMTTEAANALLKTLEEPAPNTLMILTTSVPEIVLDTVKSRCHTVKFFSAHDALPEDKDLLVAKFMARGSDDFLKDLSADKEKAADVLVALLSAVRDAMVLKSGPMVQRTMDELCAINKQIVHAKRLIDENLNVKMALSLVRERIWGN